MLLGKEAVLQVSYKNEDPRSFAKSLQRQFRSMIC